MLAIFKRTCLFALSSSLTFLIPYFSRKGNYNITRKILSLPIFRLHGNLDWPSNQAAWLHDLVQLGPSVLCRIGWEALWDSTPHLCGHGKLCWVWFQHTAACFAETKPAPVPHSSLLVRVFTFTSVVWTWWVIIFFYYHWNPCITLM